MICYPSRTRDVYFCLFFFFNDTATTEIYTLSLHDALPISSTSASQASTARAGMPGSGSRPFDSRNTRHDASAVRDRKSTRLNSSHLVISYAVFCLKKKKKKIIVKSIYNVI